MQLEVKDHHQDIYLEPYGDYLIKDRAKAEKIINDTIAKISEVNLFGNDFPTNLLTMKKSFTFSTNKDYSHF